jgi:methylated-DNA-protein-cysteine methyltransferase-like protein
MLLYHKVKRMKRMQDSTFSKIYDIVKAIPEGKVSTYGMVALLAGNPRWSRVFGYALHVNPEPGVIPCHRVVNRFGGVSKAFVFGGENMQIRLLEQEGVAFVSDGVVDLSKHLWDGR